MIKTSNKAVLGCNFELRKFVSKNDIIFVKRERPISFSVNCERTNLLSVKRDIEPSPL